MSKENFILMGNSRATVDLTFGQRLKCKIRGGERYVQVWAPDNGRVPFSSIRTIWGGGTL